MLVSFAIKLYRTASFSALTSALVRHHLVPMTSYIHGWMLVLWAYRNLNKRNITCKICQKSLTEILGRFFPVWLNISGASTHYAWSTSKYCPSWWSQKTIAHYFESAQDFKQPPNHQVSISSNTRNLVEITWFIKGIKRQFLANFLNHIFWNVSKTK